MPPVRRPRAARPQTDRCRYADRAGDRCRRVATMDGGFCRQHALALELELDDGPAMGVLGIVDRMLTSRGRAPLGTAFGSILGGLIDEAVNSPRLERMVPRAQLDEMLRRVQAQHAAAAQRRPPGPPPPRAAPPPPRVDPLLAAREVLGFEPAEALTRERVQERKKALARVFHPDMPGGSKAAMQRVLTSADALLAKMA